MTAREFINESHPGIVDNWGHQAALLSYVQVAQLMESYAQKYYVQKLDKQKKFEAAIQKGINEGIADINKKEKDGQIQKSVKGVIKYGKGFLEDAHLI